MRDKAKALFLGSCLLGEAFAYSEELVPRSSKHSLGFVLLSSGSVSVREFGAPLLRQSFILHLPKHLQLSSNNCKVVLWVFLSFSAYFCVWLLKFCPMKGSLLVFMQLVYTPANGNSGNFLFTAGALHKLYPISAGCKSF